MESRLEAIILMLFYPTGLAGLHPGESGKPEDTRSGIANRSREKGYSFTLGALALTPFGFCSIGVEDLKIGDAIISIRNNSLIRCACSRGC